MSNYSFSINLQQLPGVQEFNLDNGTGAKPYICIPLDAPFVVQGKKGIYANFLQMETPNNQYGNSHFVKVSVTKEAYDKMTDEQRKSIPIVGNAKEVVFGGQQQQAPAPQPQLQTVRVTPYQQQPQAQPVQQQQNEQDPNLPF